MEAARWFLVLQGFRLHCTNWRWNLMHDAVVTYHWRPFCFPFPWETPKDHVTVGHVFSSVDEMTLEMANGIDFGQCLLVFELRDGRGKVRILRKHRQHVLHVT